MTRSFKPPLVEGEEGDMRGVIVVVRSVELALVDRENVLLELGMVDEEEGDVESGEDDVTLDVDGELGSAAVMTGGVDGVFDISIDDLDRINPCVDVVAMMGGCDITGTDDECWIFMPAPTSPIRYVVNNLVASGEWMLSNTTPQSLCARAELTRMLEPPGCMDI